MKKIAIIRLSSIGDIVLSTPLIRSLRNKYPESRIDFIVKNEYAELLSTNLHLSNVISFDHTAGFAELRTLKKIIKKEKYDLLIDIHKNFRSVYLRNFAGSGLALKYKKDYVKRTLLVRFGLNRFKTIEPVYKRYFRAVETLGIVPDNKGTELPLTRNTILKVQTALTKSGLRQNQSLIVLCPGAGFATKKWNTKGFAEVGDYLSKKYKTMIGILGSSEDYEDCESVQNQMQERSVNYAGMFSLLESAAMLNHSSLVITNDTGLMHIAQSQNTPVVALFGSTTRELGYFPFPENSFVIEQDLGCRPCTHNGRNSCPKKHFRCMKDNKPGDVIEAADQLLDAGHHNENKKHGKNLVSSL